MTSDRDDLSIEREYPPGYTEPLTTDDVFNTVVKNDWALREWLKSQLFQIKIVLALILLLLLWKLL